MGLLLMQHPCAACKSLRCIKRLQPDTIAMGLDFMCKCTDCKQVKPCDRLVLHELINQQAFTRMPPRLPLHFRVFKTSSHSTCLSDFLPSVCRI